MGRDWKHRSPFLIVYSNFPPIVDEHEALENFRTRLPNYPFFFLLSSNTLPLPSRERGSPHFKERQGPARAFDKSTSILQGPRARPSLLSPLPLFLDSTFAHLDLEKKNLSLSLSFSLLSPLTPPPRHSAWPSPAAATATASTALTARRRRPPRGTSKGCPPRLRPAAAAAAAAGARLEGKAT